MLSTYEGMNKRRNEGEESEGGADFGDATLHDEEVRIVDVELHALEDGLDNILLGFVAIQ